MAAYFCRIRRWEREEWATTKATLIAAGLECFSGMGRQGCKARRRSERCYRAVRRKVHTGLDGKNYRICNDTDILALMETENV